MNKNKKLSSNIVFNSINANAICTLSGIFVGCNSQWYWRSYSKANLGFGTVKGRNNIVQSSLNIVVDPDYIDSPVLEFAKHK